MSENKRLPGICRKEHGHMSLYTTLRGREKLNRGSTLKWLRRLDGVETT